MPTDFSQNKEAILILDTKGHSGVVSHVITTREKEIISIADDKTIRIFDEQGTEKRKILGMIGPGPQGVINTIALSKDEQYLAVGGYFDRYDGKNAGDIRIYHYPTGKLTRLLKSHRNTVVGLSFSSDGRYLISGSTDRTAKIWDVQNGFQLVDTITVHGNEVYAVGIVKTNNGYSAVTAGFDGKIALYSINQKRIIATRQTDLILQQMAFSRDHIALAGNSKQIKIYDHMLTPVLTLEHSSEPSGIVYSPDGTLFIAGTRASQGKVVTYNAKKNYQIQSAFHAEINVVGRVGFPDPNTIASAGRDFSSIYLWDIHSGKVKSRIESAGRTVWNVGIHGEDIAWRNIINDNNQKQPTVLCKTFSFKDFTINDCRGPMDVKVISQKNGNLTLSHRSGGIYKRHNAVLEVQKNGVNIASVARDQHSGFGHNYYGWYGDLIVSGGMNGVLEIYNREGVKMATLQGHRGAITQIALDNDRLVSSSSDQTVRIWNLAQLDKNKRVMVNEKLVSELMHQAGCTRAQVIDNAALIQEKSGLSIYVTDIQVIKPVVNIFATRTNEWVVWTNEGFFNTSKAGAKYVGYHINQGPDKEAEYLSVDKFYDSFYRPDLVVKALHGEDLKAYASRINIDEILKGGLAPQVAINTPSHASKDKDIVLNLSVCEKDGGYDNLTLILNGMAIDILSKDRGLMVTNKKTADNHCFSFEKLISLQNGDNRIGFKATNRAGNIESNLAEIDVTYKGKSMGKPDLYLLAVGVDRYRDGDLWLKYSKADAQELIRTVSSVSKPLFGSIHTRTLFDQDATKSAITQAIADIGKKTNREDVFMLYVAGHGITDSKTGAYFFLPVDFRYKDESSVNQFGLSHNDFKQALSTIQAIKSLIILDTCNSGSFAEAFASRGILQKTAINKLTRATGRATIVASAKNHQVALEGYNGHGVFTYTVIEALAGEGYGKDNQITIKELASYIEDILPDRTYQKWGYEQIPQSSITGNDFPIGVR
ncbi:caspase family protein [uncultured Desulfobacter sp.]|uniref:caspase family protein n=1 Tax=uncultured Desulfobacter sp. TaxID=240139 RepID=UPI002AAC1216|nr:caspase family protein [uncultured Desulfobacter sp.]